jgi:PLP dependent protein
VSRLDSAEIAAIAAARADVLSRIGDAARSARRDPAGIRLIAVTKTVPPARVRAGLAAGLTDLGENRVQEAVDKKPQVPGAMWHLIGPLQSNKSRRAVETFDAVESVDSLEVAQRLDRLSGELRPGRPLPVLLQVNVADDPAKAGFAAAALERDLPVILGLTSLRVDGLMTIGRLVVDPEATRSTFAALRSLAANLRRTEPGLGAELSMGMSDDFPVAVEEGATILRLGRALFGPRV